MAQNTEEIPSASANGRLVPITATSSPGTLIHTAVSGTASEDNIYLYVCNKHTGPVEITVEFGGTTIADQIIESIPTKEGLFLVVPGLPLNNGLEVRVFAAVANVVSVMGMVNRRTD